MGDYKFDNTNYAGSGFNFGTHYDLERFPLDNSYAVLRRYFWLATDSAYKSAVEAIARKRAALRNITVNEQLNDFAHAEPVHAAARSHGHSTIDEDTWTDTGAPLSAIFDQYPEVENSSVDFRAGDGGYYLVNSEGTEVRVADRTASLRVRAEARAADGMRVRDAVDLPGARTRRACRRTPDLTAQRQALAQRVDAAGARPQRATTTPAPCSLKATAGAQIFAEVLGRNLALVRRPVMDPRRQTAVTP